MKTIDLARTHGAGIVLRSAAGNRFKVSDFSPATGDVYGHTWKDGTWNSYGKIPASVSELLPLQQYRAHYQMDGRTHYATIHAVDMEDALQRLRGRHADATGLQVWNPDHWPPREGENLEIIR